MKDYALELASKYESFNDKLNIMREYLQAYILRIMYDAKVFRSTAFVGGTALKFLYELPRFSEDLVFSIIKNDKYNFVSLIKKIKKELSLAGYSISVSFNDKKTVQYAFTRFDELMYEMGMSAHRDQKISIKIEIDTNPPKGAVLTKNIITKYFPISFVSYDIPSLFAGKLHALLNRKYTKGRDFFDIGWYLSKWKDLNPNITLLKNALKQTNWKEEIPSTENWRELISEIVKKADWKKVKFDIENFLENPLDSNIFTKENILRLIKGEFVE